MIKTTNFLIFFLFIIGLIDPAFGKSNNLTVGGYLNSAIGVYYDSLSNNLSSDYPIYGSIYLNYKKSIMEVHGELNYRKWNYNESIGIGDLYIKGGDASSCMMIGNFLENWGIGKSVNSLMAFSRHDDSYPENIFYDKKFLTSPALKMAFSKDSLTQELILSSGDFTGDVNQNLFGFKSTVINDNSSISAGVIRRIGFPPPNYFIQLKTSEEGIDEWVEVGWVYSKESKDEWSALLGVEKTLGSSEVAIELIFEKAHSLFFTTSNLYMKNNVLFNLSFYLSFNDWSSAWNGGFKFLINRYFTMEIGGFLFLGKTGKYFSPKAGSMDNNDNLYLKLCFKA